MKPPNFAPISFAFSAAFSAAAFVSSFALDPNMIVPALTVEFAQHARRTAEWSCRRARRDATIHIHK